MKTIEVNLDDHLEEFVQKMIATGEYTDNSDVVCEALTMLEEEEKLSDAPLALTPKACLEIAITDTGISDVDIFVEDVNNRRFCSAFTILEHRMKNEGYITDENGDTHSTSESAALLTVWIPVRSEVKSTCALLTIKAAENQLTRTLLQAESIFKCCFTSSH